MPDIKLPTTLGERIPLEAPCKYCGGLSLFVELRLEAQPIGSYSLSGMMPKVSVNAWPYAVCDGCGHVSRAEITQEGL